MTAARSGYLLLADISGYTAFLSGSELEHARDTLTDLLGLLIDHTKTPLVLSKLEGDAVFSYTWSEEAFKDGQTLVELIEATYVAFRRAIELMVMNNTCQCAACANVSKLDLKFFVHYGTFAQQKLGGRAELVGTAPVWHPADRVGDTPPKGSSGKLDKTPGDRDPIPDISTAENDQQWALLGLNQ